MTFKPVESGPSLSAQVYEAIKKSVLSLELRPGEVVSIGDLAEQFQTSRTPVRDALLYLEKEELVTLIPHKGAKISEITVQDVLEVFELRIVLEGYAVRVATPQLTEQDLERLDAILDITRQALDNGNLLMASDVGRGLHDIFVQKLSNRRFLTYLHELDNVYTRLRHFSAQLSGRLEKSHHEHLKIVRAVNECNPQGAEEAMTTHFLSVREDILTDLDSWMQSSANLT